MSFTKNRNKSVSSPHLNKVSLNDVICDETIDSNEMIRLKNAIENPFPQYYDFLTPKGIQLPKKMKHLKISDLQQLKEKTNEMESEIKELKNQSQHFESFESFDSLSECDVNFQHIEELKSMIPLLERVTNSYVEESQKFDPIQNNKNTQFIDIKNDDIVYVHDTVKCIESLYKSFDILNQSSLKIHNLQIPLNE